MRTFKKESQLAVAVFTMLSALLLGACADEQRKPEPQGGSKDVFAAPDGTATERAASTLEEDPSDKAGCTHIRFCDQPNSSNVIVCDTNDSTTGTCASEATRCFECCSDARFVCGTANPITFDPPFVTGTCSCAG